MATTETPHAASETAIGTGTGTETRVWITIKEAAERAQFGVKVLRRAIAKGELRAARVGGKKEIRLKPSWVDEWLEATAEPQEIRR